MNAAAPTERFTEHSVQFYADEAVLTESVSAFLGDGLRHGEVAIVVATPRHRARFTQGLTAAAIDLSAAHAQGRWVVVDAADMLARFMTDDGPDWVRFDLSVGGLLRDAKCDGRTVRAYGEMVALLWERGDIASAIEVETLWNRLLEGEPARLRCAYSAASIDSHQHQGAWEDICRLHSEAHGLEAIQRTPTPREQRFGFDSDAPRAARHFVSDVLDDWGLAELRDVASLIVSELATNAVMHARSPFAVTLSYDRGATCIAVRDDGPDVPRRRRAGATAPSGRGLALVSALATEWGTTERDGAGKVVWARVGDAVT